MKKFNQTDMFRSLPKWGLRLTSLLLVVMTAGCAAHDFGLLNPKGLIALEQRRLLFDTLALMLIVVLPVIIMSITFIYHYQISHRIKDYKPNWSHSYFLESLWWGIPCIIILILAIITWKETFKLDPFARIAGQAQPPMVIEVIALPYKWLFIYPEQNIATINYVVMPVGQQVEYWFTNDNVPMSAFFIPQLGSQIYTMAGMRTRLHLVANETGLYEGMNTQYNGFGFSDMHFTTQVMEPEKMQLWFNQIKNSPNHLTAEVYDQLLKPSIGDKPQFFSGVIPNLFNNVMGLYMRSFGPVHPRQNQAQLFHYVKSEKE